MGVQIQGDFVTVPGVPTLPTHVPRKGDLAVFRAIVRDLDLNAAAPIDLTVLPINSVKFIPIRAFVLNATANVSGASLALFSAAGGAGVTIITAVALASLTAAGKFQQLAIAALTDPIVVETLYPRLTVASGVAGTADLMLEFVDISDI